MTTDVAKISAKKRGGKKLVIDTTYLLKDGALFYLIQQIAAIIHRWTVKYGGYDEEKGHSGISECEMYLLYNILHKKHLVSELVIAHKSKINLHEFITMYLPDDVFVYRSFRCQYYYKMKGGSAVRDLAEFKDFSDLWDTRKLPQ